LLCAQDELHLYENEAGTSFTDVTSQVGLGSKVWSDAELVDLNGDGLPDMVQIKKGSAQVRLQRGGVFQPAVKLTDLTSGFSLATADVDGNGLPDIYLVQGCQSGSSTNDADLMFLNNGDGTFTQTPIPEASSGCGDVASPSDFNQDGRADMLVLNGFNATGPLQLLTFSAEDTTAPTIQGSVLAKSAGGTPGYLHQGGAYAVYANVSDGPGTGVAAVTANLTAVTTGAASVSLLPCSSGCAVGGVTYAYKSAQQTADAVLSPGIDPYTISATDAAGNASSATFTVTVDNSPPSAVDVQGSNGGTSGTIGSGDVVTATFSKAIEPSSLLAGWAGT